jgi:FkbM family methyltransferase
MIQEACLSKSQTAMEQFLSSSRTSGNHNNNNDLKYKQQKIQQQAMLDRMRTMELKLNTYLAYNSDPFFWNKLTATCQNASHLTEFCQDDVCRQSELMKVCLDDFPYNDCVVYDFGIREEPQFGVIFALPPFNCQVYAFDPSPITQKWFETNQALKQIPNYHLFHYGGGGEDETIMLREYDWGQVSIYSYPDMVLADPRNCTEGHCRYKRFPQQKLHPLPVRSVESLMKEFGHERIDMLKLDVEGSEYRMLEGMMESGTCRKVNQITMEWHHYGHDVRYGVSSSPILNLFVKLLQDKCDLEQFHLHDVSGWPSNEELYIDMKITLMYNLAAYMRVPKA